MDSDQYQLGKTKVFIKNPESVCTGYSIPHFVAVPPTRICVANLKKVKIILISWNVNTPKGDISFLLPVPKMKVNNR